MQIWERAVGMKVAGPTGLASWSNDGRALVATSDTLSPTAGFIPAIDVLLQVLFCLSQTQETLFLNDLTLTVQQADALTVPPALL
jgi:hypothetical protein